jgi:hypothetical protein
MSLEKRVSADHPRRVIRSLTDSALSELSQISRCFIRV